MRELLERQKAGDDVKNAIDERVEYLMPTYRNIAICFADLHDTPIRTKAVGAIQVCNIFSVYYFLSKRLTLFMYFTGYHKVGRIAAFLCLAFTTALF